jgi:aryl-alcohol dehydrogenase-like predicted oxidoreductase
MYNLVKRTAEIEILPMAKSLGIAVIPYSPTGGGLLTGKYGVGVRPESGRLVENAAYQKRYGDTIHWETADRFKTFAAEKGYQPTALAVAWVMSHPAITAPIIGARSVAQLESSLAAIDIPMTPELRDEVSALSIEPAVATDRSEERA